ncbi:MAG: glycosyltransferase family 87 protein [Pirellulales bacterium]|nr:glycosyltransferase family 87 protein [Pirellulales bacterium]
MSSATAATLSSLRQPTIPCGTTASSRRWQLLALCAWGLVGMVLGARLGMLPYERSVLDEYAFGPASWWSDDVFVYETTIHYLYTPTFTVCYSLIWMWPPGVAAILWTMLNLCSLYAGLRALNQRLLPVVFAGWGPREQACLQLLALWGCFRGMWSGQANALVAGLACLAAVAIYQRQWWRAALWLTLPVFIKIWPVALLLLFVAAFPRQLAWRLAALFAAFAALPWFTRDWAFVMRQHVGYVDMLLHRRQQIRLHGYRDFWTIWEQFATPVPAAYQVLQIASGLGLAYAALHWAKRANDPVNRASMVLRVTALWACWQLLLGPGSERLTLGICAPFAAVALIAGWGRGVASWSYGVALAAWCGLFVLGLGEIERALARVTHPAVQAIAPGGVILLALWWLFWNLPGDQPRPASLKQLPDRTAAVDQGNRTPAVV